MNDSLAASLWQARQSGQVISVGDEPADITAAYRVQQTLSDVSGCRVIGFKIGATMQTALDTLGLDEPFYGPLFDRYCHTGGAEVPIGAAHKALLETEFVIGIGQDLRPAGASVTQADIEAVTAWVAPGFELVCTRFDMALAGNGVRLVADSGGNMDFVMGEPYTDWRELNLNEHPASLEINGEAVASGHSGMSLYGHPAAMTAWLANHPTLAGRGLRAGDIITTGTCTGMTPVKPGDIAVADFGVMGTLETRFVVSR